jgi:hypothetical protein
MQVYEVAGKSTAMQKEIDTPRLKLILIDQSTIDDSKYLESAHAILSSPEATQWRYEITF